MRLVQGGKLGWNPVEQGGRIPGGILCFLLLFDRFPVVNNIPGTVDGDIPEDVGVAACQFFRNAVDDIINVEAPQFLSQSCVKNDMKEKISEFLGKAAIILGIDRFEDFIDFFDEHRFQRLEILLPIPGTAFRSPQLGHNLNQSFKLTARHPASPLKLVIIAGTPGIR